MAPGVVGKVQELVDAEPGVGVADVGLLRAERDRKRAHQHDARAPALAVEDAMQEPVGPRFVEDIADDHQLRAQRVHPQRFIELACGEDLELAVGKGAAELIAHRGGRGDQNAGARLVHVPHAALRVPGCPA